MGFPNDLVDGVSVVRETTDDVVYNILTSGASIAVNGVTACTLGHELSEPVVRHGYFGSRAKIESDLQRVDEIGFKRGYVRLSSTTEYTRNSLTFEIEGLK